MTPLPFTVSKRGTLAFLVDNSTLETLTCPRLYQLKHLRKRDLVAARAGRNFGAGLHVGWKERYTLCGSNPVDVTAELAINAAIAAHFAGKPQPEGDFRTLDHAQRVMKCYNDFYKRENFEILKKPNGSPAVECSFAFQLGTLRYPGVGKVVAHDGKYYSSHIDIFYMGRMDLLVRNTEGFWAGPDHKSTQEYGQGFADTYQTDAGQKGYVWAATRYLGQPVKGYIIDGVRIRRPKRMDEYTGAPPVDSSDFLRIPHYVFPDELAEWEEDTLAKVETIFWMHSRGYFQKHTRMCRHKYGRCDMFDVCTTSRANRENTLASDMFEDLEWSPLNPVEQLEERKE